MSQSDTQPVDACENRDILQIQTRSLATRNLNELERELAQLERMLTPLLNQIRAMLGKKPIKTDIRAR